MDLTAALLQFLAFLLLGLGLAEPAVRRYGLAAGGLAALFGLVHGATGPAERTLMPVHHYAGYEGSALEVSMVAFPTMPLDEPFAAPGWQWSLPFLGFVLVWGTITVLLGKKTLKSPFLLPMLYAWSAATAWLAMQALAAPSAVVQPVGIDRFLWPAGLALSLLVARQARGILVVIIMVSASMLAIRLPIAMFSKYASDERLGTSLDITAVTESTDAEIVNPMTQMTFDPGLAPGSDDQQFWLIWLEHLIIFPALYTLSLFGIALGVHLWHKHRDDPE